jgi:hypothetical protein
MRRSSSRTTGDSPSQILVAGFGLAAVLWPAPLSIERVRNAA